MSEVTKITVTFDDGTEHVVFQVAKVVVEPTRPCTIRDEPCGRTVTSTRPATQTLAQEVIGGLLERLERPAATAPTPDPEPTPTPFQKWASVPPEAPKYEIVPGGHTTHTLKTLLAEMFDRGPLKFWLVREASPDEGGSVSGVSEADDADEALMLAANNRLADTSNWVRVMKVHAKNFPPYKDVLDYIGRNKSNQWCGAAPNMPNDDDMIVRVFKMRPGVYDQVVDGLQAPLGIQVVMVTTPNDDQLVGWALQETYR